MRELLETLISEFKLRLDDDSSGMVERDILFPTLKNRAKAAEKESKYKRKLQDILH